MVCILQGTKRSLGHWKIYWLFSRSLIFKWSSWPQEHLYYMVMVRAQCLGFFQGALFISTLLSINSLILNKSLKSKDMYGNHRCGLACITYRGSRIPGDGLFNRRLEEDKDNSSWAMDPTFLDWILIPLPHFTPMAKKSEENIHKYTGAENITLHWLREYEVKKMRSTACCRQKKANFTSKSRNRWEVIFSAPLLWHVWPILNYIKIHQKCEMCYCSCLPLLPGFVCSVHATHFSRAL